MSTTLAVFLAAMAGKWRFRLSSISLSSRCAAEGAGETLLLKILIPAVENAELPRMSSFSIGGEAEGGAGVA